MTSHVAPGNRRPRPSSISHAALGLVLLSLSGPGNADATPADRCQADASCRKQMTSATQLASKGRYEEAITLYEQGYTQSHEPRLLLNIGRCHYRLGRPSKALELYEEFNRAQPSPDAELSSRYKQFVAEAKLAILTAEKEKPEPVATAVSTPPTPPPLTPEPPATEGRMIFGRPAWRVGVGAGAAAVGGVLFGIGIGALAAHGRCVTPSENFAGRCAAQLEPDGLRSTVVLDGITPGVPLLVSGALLLTGGVLLIALPSRAKKSALRRPLDLVGASRLVAF